MFTPYTRDLTHSLRARSLGILVILCSAGLPAARSQGAAAVLPSSLNEASSCALATSTREIARCLTEHQPQNVLPRLEPGVRYDLPQLIDLAEGASPEGRISWNHAKRAMELVGIQRAEYLPVLSLAAQGSDLRAIVPFPKPIAPRGYVTVEEPTALAQLELQYRLLDFGRGPRLAGSKAFEVASSLRLGRTQQTIEFHAASQFYRAQEAAGQLAAAEAIFETAQTLQHNAQSQFDNGRATLPDVQNAEAGAAEAAFDLASARGEVKKAKLALTETIGVEPTVDIEIVPQDDTPPEAFDSPVEELIQTAWKLRPDLLAKVQDLQRAHQASKEAHAAYLPTVGISGTGGQTSMWPTADYGQLGPASVSTWSAAVQLRWDIFDGARSHRVGAAVAEEHAAAEEKRALQDAVTRGVWESYVDYQTALEQEKASERFLTSAQTSYDSSLDAFKYGVRSLVDVVQAERQLAQARLAAVRAHSHRLQSAAALGYALGEQPQDLASGQGVRP